MFIMVLQCQGQRPPRINQRGLNLGSALQKAHTIIYLIIWRCVRLLCKQIGMQIAFVCFFSPQSFSGWFKALAYPAITHTHTHIEDNVFWHERAGQTSDECSPSPPGLIFSWLSRGMCAQINQAPCSNQSHLYHPANKWHCSGGEINRG